MRRRPTVAPRSLLRAAVVAASASAVALGCGDSSSEERQDEPRAALRVEKATSARSGAPELVVSVAQPNKNVPATANGRRSVTLLCEDSMGTELVRGRHAWPFFDTDGGLLEAHVHQPVRASRMDLLRRCRLEGTEGPLSGRVPR